MSSTSVFERNALILWRDSGPVIEIKTPASSEDAGHVDNCLNQ